MFVEFMPDVLRDALANALEQLRQHGGAIARLPEDLVPSIWSSAISTSENGHKYGVLGSFSVTRKTGLHFRPHLPAVLRGRFSAGGEIPFVNYSKRQKSGLFRLPKWRNRSLGSIHPCRSLERSRKRIAVM